MPPRYGIAYNADIYVGKVLDDAGNGADGWIIAGIEWAINNNCHIVSMSLGSPKGTGDPFDTEYESLARRALDAGTLIIAAAGNNSERPDSIEPINGPADCPSIMAIAAVYSASSDAPFVIAPFSNAGVNASGGEVNFAAPGVGIYSSYLRPTEHTKMNGTSMATPHVAGIAALFAEANPQVRGRDLWKLLESNARRLSFSPQDVGIGLVQAP
jgi:subtilisin family serine protease